MSARPLLSATGLALAALLTGGVLRAQNVVAWAPADLATSVAEPRLLERAPGGGLYIAGALPSSVVRLDPSGELTLVADGSDSLMLGLPICTTTDAAGNLYVGGFGTVPGTADAGVVRISPAGVVTELLDTGLSVDGIAVDPAGNVYAATSFDVFRIEPDGTVVEYDMTGWPDIDGIEDLILDDNANLYLAGRFTNNVLLVRPSGVVLELFDATGDGQGNLPSSLGALALDELGDLYILDASLLAPDSAVFKVSPGGAVTHLLGAAGVGGVPFADATDITPAPGGGVYVSASTPAALFHIAPDGTASVVLEGDADCPAGFGLPRGLFVDDAGVLHFAAQDTGNIMRLVAPGVAEVLSSGLTPAAEALAVGPAGRLHGLTDHRAFVADLTGEVEQAVGPPGTCVDFVGGALRDVVVDASGTLHATSPESDELLSWTAASGVTATTPDDGEGHVIRGPGPLALGVDGSVYVAGEDSHEVYRVEPDGTVTRVVDRGGDPLAGNLLRPSALAVAPDDTLYVAGGDSGNVLRRDPDGTVTEIMTQLARPCSLALDGLGNLHVGLELGGEVLRRAPDGTVTTFVGSLPDGVNALGTPCDLAFDRDGNLIVAGGDTPNVFLVDPTGVATRILGPAGDGQGATVPDARAVATDAFGNVYVGAGSAGVFRVEPDDAWTNLGGSAPGASGHPALSAAGALTPGSPLSLRLLDAPAGAVLLAWLSFASTPFDALGGTVHAFPTNVQQFFLADGDGRWQAGLAWPAGVPAGTDLFLQLLVEDASVPGGINLSNAVTSTTP